MTISSNEQAAKERTKQKEIRTLEVPYFKIFASLLSGGKPVVNYHT